MTTNTLTILIGLLLALAVVVRQIVRQVQGGPVAATSDPVGGTAEPRDTDRRTPVPSAAPHGSTVRSASLPATTALSSWGYQLQNLDIDNAARSPFDVLVIDPSLDGSDATALTPAQLEQLKRKADGSRRLVLAYLSIGEAESYRPYWDKRWNRNKPEWLLGENPEWKENYAVCFWHPGWQAIMCGSPEARLDRVLAAGFDGVYFDKCDVYDDLKRKYKAEATARPDLEGDMVDFIAALSAYAKRSNPAFQVVMQNAEDLLDRAPLRACLDGVAKEELVYGCDGPEKLNAKGDFDDARDKLDLMRADGKLVLVVEYLNDQRKIDHASEVIAPLGYVLYVSPKNRKLDRLNYSIVEA